MHNNSPQLIAKSAVSLRSIGLLAPTGLNRYNSMRILIILILLLPLNSYASCYMGELDPSLMKVKYAELSNFSETVKRIVTISIPTFHDLPHDPPSRGKDIAKVVGIYLTSNEPYLKVPLNILEENGNTTASFEFQESDLFAGFEIIARIDYKWDKPYPSRCNAHAVVVKLNYNKSLKQTD